MGSDVSLAGVSRKWVGTWWELEFIEERRTREKENNIKGKIPLIVMLHIKNLNSEFNFKI